VNLSALATGLVPPGVVTRMLSAQGLCAGDTAVISVADFTVKLVAASAPKTTFVAPVNAVPVIVTVVPPATGPDAGKIAVIAGAAVANVEARAVAGSKPPLTVASTMPTTRNRTLMTRRSSFASKDTWPNARDTIGEIIAARQHLCTCSTTFSDMRAQGL
jgi:hypothetical protein